MWLAIRQSPFDEYSRVGRADALHVSKPNLRFRADDRPPFNYWLVNSATRLRR
jgi:hypothetical protein